MARKPWQEVAKIAQEVRDRSIALVQPPVPSVPAELPLNVTRIPQQFLTLAEIEITQTPAETLVEKLASAKLTSVEVTNAFLRRAGLAQKLVWIEKYLKEKRRLILFVGKLYHGAYAK
jgi:hypothetical protein